MKTLHLLRHAKSSWDHDGLDDHARPLTPRGRRNARAMGDFLARAGVELDRVRCSTARRAVETWEGVASGFGGNVEKILDESLYLADPASLLDLVQREDASVSSLLLVGHNPGLGELAVALCGHGSRDALKRMGSKFPTGAWAGIRFDCEAWRDVRPQAGILLGFQVPRELG